MSIFDTNIRHPAEDLLTRAQEVVCDTVRHSLSNYLTDPGYLVRQIGHDLKDEGLWWDANKPEEDQIYKKIFGIKVKKEGYKARIPYYKVSLCWGWSSEFFLSDHIIPGRSIDIYVGINGIIHGDI